MLWVDPYHVETSEGQWLDEGAYFASRIVFNSVADQDYAVVIASFGTNSGRYLLEWRFTPTAPLPEILISPLSQTVAPGGLVQLQVQATHATGYQWYFQEAPLPGTDTNLLVLTNADAQVVGAYRVQVMGSSGSVLSDVAEVEVGTQPAARSFDKFEELEAQASGLIQGQRMGEGVRLAWGSGSPLLLVSDGYSGQQIIGWQGTTSAGELGEYLQTVVSTRYLGLKPSANGMLLITANRAVIFRLYHERKSELVATSGISSDRLTYAGMQSGHLYYLELGGVSLSVQSPLTLDFWLGGPPVASGQPPLLQTVPIGGTVVRTNVVQIAPYLFQGPTNIRYRVNAQ